MSWQGAFDLLLGSLFTANWYSSQDGVYLCGINFDSRTKYVELKEIRHYVFCYLLSTVSCWSIILILDLWTEPFPIKSDTLSGSATPLQLRNKNT